MATMSGSGRGATLATKPEGEAGPGRGTIGAADVWKSDGEADAVKAGDLGRSQRNGFGMLNCISFRR